LLDRTQLPAVSGCAYLNAGTNGPLPRAAAAAMAAETEAALNSPRIGETAFERFWDVRGRAREAAARRLGAPAEEVAVTTSTSQGIGLVTAGLDWEFGDEIVTTTEEHPGLLGPLDELRARRGAVIRAVAADDIVASIGPTTRMVALSHVLWTTGRILALPEIAEAAHAVGALLLVDGAQSAGQLDLRMEETGADFYAVSGQKWLMGPTGTGALWVHPRHHERMRPAIPSYLTYADGVVGNLRPDAARFDPGTLDLASLAGLAASVGWVDGLEGGWEAWLALARERVAAARARLAVAGIPAVDPPGGSTGLVAFELPGHDPVDVVPALAERSVLLRYIPDTPYLRLSVGAWTTDADLDALIDGLEAIRAGDG
jgi:selenocysteine lyase/cysteine desulfurase